MKKDNLDDIKNKLCSDKWIKRLEAVKRINEMGIPVDDEQEDELVTLLAHVSNDPKWEVRRCVASTLANFRYIKVSEIIDILAVDSNKWVKDAAERTKHKLKINASTDKRDRKYDYALSLVRRLKKKYPEELNDEILDNILKSVLEVGEQYYEEFASDATHQINTVLTAINHSIEELQEKLPIRSNSEIGERFRNLLEQEERLINIMKDLRVYSAPYDTGFTSESLESILQEALSRAKNIVCCFKKDFQCKENIRLDSALILDTHKEGLINAFTNIICNAYEAMPDRGTLEIIASSTRPGHINVIISDTGIGMTGKQIEDAKKRWTTSKKKGTQRTGLGLPIALKIIERCHKGKVTIKSKKIQGTRVSIELPIHKEEESLI